MGQVWLRCPVCGEHSHWKKPSAVRKVCCPHCGSWLVLLPGHNGGMADLVPLAEYQWSAQERNVSDNQPVIVEPSPARLPATVIIGLALLPLGVPLLWLIGPVLTGIEPPVSIATALALTVSVSVLCLSVIYTIDWTPETRLKGVLILIVLAYFGGATLYFTKKTTLESLYHLGKEKQWQEFRPEQGPPYRVRVPLRPEMSQLQPLPLAVLQCYQARVPQDFWGWHTYIMGAGEPAPHPEVPGSDGWFQDARNALLADGGLLRREFQTSHGFLQGREWEIQLPPAGLVRIVRLYVGRGKVYYLAVEGEQLDPSHPDVQRFFRSFFIPPL